MKKIINKKKILSEDIGKLAKYLDINLTITERMAVTKRMAKRAALALTFYGIVMGLFTVYL